MGYQLSKSQVEAAFRRWTEQYDVFAPMLMKGEGCFSDTDIIRYGKPACLEDLLERVGLLFQGGPAGHQ